MVWPRVTGIPTLRTEFYWNLRLTDKYLKIQFKFNACHGVVFISPSSSPPFSNLNYLHLARMGSRSAEISNLVRLPAQLWGIKWLQTVGIQFKRAATVFGVCPSVETLCGLSITLYNVLESKHTLSMHKNDMKVNLLLTLLSTCRHDSDSLQWEFHIGNAFMIRHLYCKRYNMY